MRYIKSYNNTADLRNGLAAGELGNPYVAKVNNTIDFNSISTNWENEYFTIIALTDGSIRYNHKDGSNPMFLSINEGEWIDTTFPLNIPVSKNDMIRFKSNRGNRAYDNNKGTFTSGCTAQFVVAGNLMSLVAGDDFATYVPYTNATVGNGDLYRSFRYFFKYCTGLISAKNLIIKYCDYDAFREFFNGCTNLLMPPELPATTLAKFCYSKMFGGCTSLTTAPVLPANTLVDSCYQNMFAGCTSLTTAPKLPATNLTNNCYGGMFSRCTSLTTAPELPATTLANNCYQNMFRECASLTTAPVLPATTLADSCYSNMFYGTNVLPDCSNIDFASSTVVASRGLKGLFAGTKVTDNDLERLLPKNDNGRYYLPVTTLADSCYNSMFQGCTSLTKAPELPATTLANNCYGSMFEDCASLTTAPSLPATTLADNCYQDMFSGTNVLPDCSNIDFASSTVVASGGLQGLFAGTKVTDNDLERLLPKNDNGRYYLPVTTLARNCYSFMFSRCTSLTTAPELPATTLADSCYQFMFSRCTSLNYIKCLATDISAPNCTGSWVSGVASTGTFVKPSSMTSWAEGNSGIPTGWTIIDA